MKITLWTEELPVPATDTKMHENHKLHLEATGGYDEIDVLKHMLYAFLKFSIESEAKNSPLEEERVGFL